MSEILLPSVLVSGGVWTKEGGGAAVIASFDEGCSSPDDDTTYIEQSDDENGTPLRFRFSTPIGSPDFGSGIASWALRVRHKYVTVQAFSYAIQLRVAGNLYSEFTPTLTSSYSTSLMLFNPAGIGSLDDFQVWLFALPDTGGSVRVTAADLSIETLTGGYSSFQNERLRGQFL